MSDNITLPRAIVQQAQEPFEDLATELFVIAQTSPADDGFSDTIERIELWLREHFSTPPQQQAEPVAYEQTACWACNGLGHVTTSSNGSGLIEEPCIVCIKEKS